jgi:SAM-dependent methyltransferase
MHSSYRSASAGSRVKDVKTKHSQVKKFWDERAVQGGISSQEVTHKDIWQRWLEIKTISNYLRKKDRVLDVGCGNGYSTRIFSGLCKEIVGIDYSNEMIDRARAESEKRGERATKLTLFAQCDVLELNPSLFGLFDLIISERCLINLGSFEKQKRAIAQIASVLKRGGRFIFVEGTADGRENLNRFRKAAGLSPMPRVWHNLDFRERETLAYFKRHFRIEERKYFGLYDFLSRVVHPLVVRPEEPQYDAAINEVAAKLSVNCGEFAHLSRVIFLVMRKK